MIAAIPRALGLVLADRRAALATALLFLVLFALYAALLPASMTGGIVGLVSLSYLTWGEAGLALAMAALLAPTLALGFYGLRHGGGSRPAGSLAGALLAAVPPLFCCSPLLPLAIAMIAGVAPAAARFGLPVQGFIATHEGGFYAAAIGLMAWGLLSNARRVLYCPRAGVRCATATGSTNSTSGS
jgi:hypothetical protein